VSPSDRLARELAQLPPSDKAELARLLAARAETESRELTVEEAREAIRAADIPPAWHKTVLVDIGRIRHAAKELILAGWQPERIATALAEAALEFETDGRLVGYALAAGIADGLRLRA
jgi:hypothetical protein